MLKSLFLFQSLQIHEQSKFHNICGHNYILYTVGRHKKLSCYLFMLLQKFFCSYYQEQEDYGQLFNSDISKALL